MYETEIFGGKTVMSVIILLLLEKVRYLLLGG